MADQRSIWHTTGMVLFCRFRTPASHLPNITLFRGLPGVDFPGNRQSPDNHNRRSENDLSVSTLLHHVARSMARSVRCKSKNSMARSIKRSSVSLQFQIHVCLFVVPYELNEKGNFPIQTG